jgi:hypothetical protein
VYPSAHPSNQTIARFDACWSWTQARRGVRKVAIPTHDSGMCRVDNVRARCAHFAWGIRHHEMSIAVRAVHLLAACAAAATCGAPVVAPDSNIKAGRWGGPHVAMMVTPEQTEIEFDCGRASVDGTIPLDRDDAFTATGTFLQERPGPTRPDGPPRRPMRLTGGVKDDTMNMRVILTDQNEDLGSFTLAFGADARLVKCK